MTTILAIDLGTKMGWALLQRKGKASTVTSGTVSFVNDRYQGGGMRYLKFSKWLNELKSQTGSIDEVYFEEVRNHGKFGTVYAQVYGGFLGILTSWCEEKKIPYQGVPVGTIKKSISGKGNANKKAVIDAVKALGYLPSDDNEADAIALLLFKTS